MKDEGIGIDPQWLPYIFELFAQIDRSQRQSQSGLGIGLAVVRKLVQLHGGQVRAHSDGIGRGSEFTVELPVTRTAGSRATTAG